MASWQDIEQDAPDFAARVRARFDAGTNKTIATLRRDGAPRISGSELQFANGQVTLGMMGRSSKLLDVRRDPRIAIHSPTIEPPYGEPSDWPGDAKTRRHRRRDLPTTGKPARRCRLHHRHHRSRPHLRGHPSRPPRHRVLASPPRLATPHPPLTSQRLATRLKQRQQRTPRTPDESK